MVRRLARALEAPQHLSPLHLDEDVRVERGATVSCAGASAAAGSRGAFLQMHEGNARARRFYEKLGFERIVVGGGAAGGDGEGAGTGGDFYMGIALSE